MKSTFSVLLLHFILLFALPVQSQERPINPLTLKGTYSIKDIHGSLRQLIDRADKASYFNDDFFIDLLQKILKDNQFSEKEKTQLFYLMQKKIGYAFTGVEYLPPGINYFNLHLGKLAFYNKIKSSLQPLNLNADGFLQLVDSNAKRDPIVSSNALLLATLINGNKTLLHIEKYSQPEAIRTCIVPSIMLHYVAMSASIQQNDKVVQHFNQSLKTFTMSCMKEDILCFLNCRTAPLSPLKDYILSEKSQLCETAIQTAVCIIASKIPEASFKQNILNISKSAKEPWKATLLKSIAEGKIPYNYTQTSKDHVTSKTWDNVQMTLYTDGTYLINGPLIEFDPN